jgi:hypothetical protein
MTDIEFMEFIVRNAHDYKETLRQFFERKGIDATYYTQIANARR